MRRLFHLLLVALALAGSAREAAGHAVLVETVPADGATLVQSPDAISLVFNEPVAPIAVRLLNEAGEAVAGVTVAAIDRTVTLRPDRPLRNGTYVVSYRVTSEDSHAVAGSILFAVGTAAVRPQPAAGAMPGGWRIVAAVNRMLWLMLSLSAAGLALFLLLCGALLTPEQAARTRRLLTAAALLALPCAVLAIGLAGGLLLDADTGALFDSATWRVGGATTLGRNLAAAVAGLAILGVAGTLRSEAKRAIAYAVGVALVVASFGLSGHAATVEPAMVMGPTVAVHAGLAAFWWGGLLGLAIALDGAAPTAAVPVVRRFSRAGVWLVALLVSLGGAIALVQVRRVGLLFETGYGLALCGKLVAVAALLSIAVHNKLRLTPRLAAGDATALEALRGSVRIEIGLVAIVFAVTASLGQLPPPRSMIGAATATAVTAEATAGNSVARIELSPGRAGRNELFLQLDSGGRPLAASEVVLAAALPSAGIEAIRRPLHAVGTGRYHLPELTLPVAGRWSLHIEALVSDFDRRSFHLEIDIAR